MLIILYWQFTANDNSDEDHYQELDDWWKSALFLNSKEISLSRNYQEEKNKIYSDKNKSKIIALNQPKITQVFKLDLVQADFNFDSSEDELSKSTCLEIDEKEAKKILSQDLLNVIFENPEECEKISK